MSAIGYGPLPSPGSLSTAAYAGWYVPSESNSSEAAYYELVNVDNQLVWIRNNKRIIESSDPVIFADGFARPLSAWINNEVQGVEQSFTNSMAWVMYHTLPYTPHVSVKDQAGRELIATINHVSNLQVIASHNSLQSGTMRLS